MSINTTDFLEELAVRVTAMRQAIYEGNPENAAIFLHAQPWHSKYAEQMETHMHLLEPMVKHEIEMKYRAQQYSKE